MTHLTAERRVRAIFYWAHVLGLRAQVIHAEVRVHVQLAVTYLQLILIALRGHRPYTRPELVTVFEDCGRQFFSHLERITQYNEECRVNRQQIRHDRNPDRHAKPIPFRRRPRFVRIEQVIDHAHLHTPLHVYAMHVYVHIYTPTNTVPRHIYLRTSTHSTTRLRNARLRVNMYVYEHSIHQHHR